MICKNCKPQLFTFCIRKAGARIGCSISASSKCKPSWLRSLFGAAPVDFAAREQCEEREMSSCLAASRDSCLKLAKDKCLASFQDARIAMIDCKEISKLIFWAPPTSTARSMRSKPIWSSQPGPCLSSKSDLEVTNYRGSALLRNCSSTENSPGESGCKEPMKA